MRGMKGATKSRRQIAPRLERMAFLVRSALDGVGIVCLLCDGGAGLPLQSAIRDHFLLRFCTLALSPVYRGEKKVNGWFARAVLHRHQKVRQRLGLPA